MKRIVTFLLAAVFVFSVAACSSNDSGTSGSSSSAGGSSADETSTAGQSTANTDDIIINLYAHSDNQSAAEAQAAAYNAKDNGITVVTHIIANDDYDDKLKVLAAGSSGELDVFWVRSPSQVKTFMNNGVLADLSAFASDTGLDLTPIEGPLTNVSDDSGAFYGMPWTSSCWMLFYNKELFDAKGLDYPVNLTWEEYCDLAQELTYEEGGTKYWGGIVPNWTLNLGATSADEYLTADEPMERAMEYSTYLHRMYVEDKSNLGIAEMSAGTFDIHSYFGAGNIYMMVNGDWEFNLLETDFEYGAAPMPVLDGVEEGSTVGQASYFCISKDSKHPKEAYEFIEFMTTTAEGTSIIVEQTKNVPCYSTDEAMAVFEELVKVEGVEYRFSAKIKDEQGTEPYYESLNEIYRQEIELYLLEEQSLEEAFENYYALREETIGNS